MSFFSKSQLFNSSSLFRTKNYLWGAAMVTTEGIRNFARDNGIHAVGWFAAADFNQYLATIQERIDYHKIAYRPLDAFLKAGHVPEGFRTVIVLVMDYFVESSDLPDGYRLSNYVRACWNTIGPKSKAMVEFLKAKGYRAEGLNVPQRAAACRAGLGFIGRNAMFYAHGLGSYVGIESIGTDSILENTGPVQERVTHPKCENCGRCITACPVGAISPSGYQIEPLKCLSMVNRHPDEPLLVMPRKREQFDRWLCGCETCQNVCPLNKEALHKHETVVMPEINIGMTIPNTPIVPRETIEASLDSITSPGYQEYIRRLLGRRR